MPDSGRAPDDELAQLELKAVVLRAVSELPARLREVISLFYFEGYDASAAARFLDIPDGTFRRRMHEGRKLLRSSVERSLQRGAVMNDERERRIERLRSLIENPDDADGESLFQAVKESLAIRPVPKQLAALFHSKAHLSYDREPAGAELIERVQHLAKQFTGPSARALAKSAHCRP